MAFDCFRLPQFLKQFHACISDHRHHPSCCSYFRFWPWHPSLNLLYLSKGFHLVAMVTQIKYPRCTMEEETKWNGAKRINELAVRLKLTVLICEGGVLNWYSTCTKLIFLVLTQLDFTQELCSCNMNTPTFHFNIFFLVKNCFWVLNSYSEAW